MRVAEALHIGQRSVLGREVVDRVSSGEELALLRGSAVLYVDGETHMRHLPVDLRNPIALDAIERVHAVTVDDQLRPEGMIRILAEGQRILAVAFLKASRSPMDRDHRDLALGPLL